MPRFRIMATTYRSHRHQVDIRNSNSSWLLTAESGHTLTLRVVPSSSLNVQSGHQHRDLRPSINSRSAMLSYDITYAMFRTWPWKSRLDPVWRPSRNVLGFYEFVYEYEHAVVFALYVSISQAKTEKVSRYRWAVVELSDDNFGRLRIPATAISSCKSSLTEQTQTQAILDTRD
jgi:hypothetical protein